MSSTMCTRVRNNCEWFYMTLIIYSLYKIKIELYHLPPFNKIGVLSYIMLHHTKIMVQF